MVSGSSIQAVRPRLSGAYSAHVAIASEGLGTLGRTSGPPPARRMARRASFRSSRDGRTWIEKKKLRASREAVKKLMSVDGARTVVIPDLEGAWLHDESPVETSFDRMARPTCPSALFPARAAAAKGIFPSKLPGDSSLSMKARHEADPDRLLTHRASSLTQSSSV